MSPLAIFAIVALLLLGFVMFLDRKYFLLRDASAASPRPYSFARTQLTWWTIIVIGSFISILLIKEQIPELLESTLILLGITSGTTVAAKVIDVGDNTNPATLRHQDLSKSQNFLLDILSDENGVSIHRLQTVLFNVTFGIWFLVDVGTNLNNPMVAASAVMPEITQNNLILLGLSSATYVGLKATENKPNAAVPADHVRDEALDAARPVG